MESAELTICKQRGDLGVGMANHKLDDGNPCFGEGQDITHASLLQQLSHLLHNLPLACLRPKGKSPHTSQDCTSYAADQSSKSAQAVQKLLL